VTTILKDTVEELPIVKEKNEINYKEDFFGRKAYLTVSGQLNVECFCCGLGRVYTFGPTFRAEKSFTPKHLSEFWMIEPEIAFADLTDSMNIAEAYLKYCVQYVMDNCYEDLQVIYYS
jgi:asparaginyl-tRNA synthetase